MILLVDFQRSNVDNNKMCMFVLFYLVLVGCCWLFQRIVHDGMGEDSSRVKMANKVTSGREKTSLSCENTSRERGVVGTLLPSSNRNSYTHRKW